MNTAGKGYKFPKGSQNPNYTHGLSINGRHSRTYSAWANMVNRCCNPRAKDFKHYGAKGIHICKGLRSDALGIKEAIGVPRHKQTLNRINNNGNYSCGKCIECINRMWPLNIEWTTWKHQSRNRGDFNVRLTLNGETHCISEWSEILGIRAGTIRRRIERGWTEHSAILSTDMSTNSYKMGKR